ncbi:MAG: universal stress protein [Bryobacteraceae bacterium]
MPVIGKILAPVDFSEPSRFAAVYAAALARDARAELILLHALPSLDSEFSFLPHAEGRLKELSSQRAANVRRKTERFLVGDLEGLTVRRVVAEGDPAEQIVQYAYAQKVSLIVIPTRGYGPVRRFLLGSVASKVLHDADCPVLTGVHMGDPKALASAVPVKHILCAVDLGPQTEHVLEWASGMATTFSARITVVHAVPPLEPQWREPLMATAMQDLTGHVERFAAGADLLVDAGDPQKVVAAAAARLEANLVAIGRGVDNGIIGRLRAHAYAIIRDSPCPVVSV